MSYYNLRFLECVEKFATLREDKNHNSHNSF